MVQPQLEPRKRAIFHLHIKLIIAYIDNPSYIFMVIPILIIKIIAVGEFMISRFQARHYLDNIII